MFQYLHDKVATADSKTHVFSNIMRSIFNYYIQFQKKVQVEEKRMYTEPRTIQRRKRTRIQVQLDGN